MMGVHFGQKQLVYNVLNSKTVQVKVVSKLIISTRIARNFE